MPVSITIASLLFLVPTAVLEGHPHAPHQVNAQVRGGDPGSVRIPVDTLEEAREIRRRRELSNAAIARHDSAAFASVLAREFSIVTSNSAHWQGRDAYAAQMAAQFRSRPDVVYRRTPSSVHVFAPWRMASELGEWTGSWSDADGRITIGGTYFAKWRKLDDAWVIESETFVPTHCRGGVYCSRVP